MKFSKAAVGLGLAAASLLASGVASDDAPIGKYHPDYESILTDPNPAASDALISGGQRLAVDSMPAPSEDNVNRRMLKGSVHRELKKKKKKGGSKKGGSKKGGSKKKGGKKKGGGGGGGGGPAPAPEPSDCDDDGGGNDDGFEGTGGLSDPYDDSKDYYKGYKKDIPVPDDGEFLIMFIGQSSMKATDFCKERFGADKEMTDLPVVNDGNSERVRSAMAFFQTLADPAPYEDLVRSNRLNGEHVHSYRYRFDLANKAGTMEKFSLCKGCGCTMRTQFYGQQYESLNAGPDMHGGNTYSGWFDTQYDWCLANAQEFGRDAAACEPHQLVFGDFGPNTIETTYDTNGNCNSVCSPGGGALIYAQVDANILWNPCYECNGAQGYVTKIVVKYDPDTHLMAHLYYHQDNLLGTEKYDLAPYY